jgi:hypothetical protein
MHAFKVARVRPNQSFQPTRRAPDSQSEALLLAAHSQRWG